MPIVDERGRLWGRVNLIDFAVGVFCLLLVPLAYGAYVLFRTPTPIIAAIEPASLQQGKDLRVKLTGTGFRPFLTASVGVAHAPGMLVESPSAAEVRLPELGPGTYDLALHDESREVARRPNAITIVGPPTPPNVEPPAPPYQVVVQVSGTFTSVPEQVARTFVVGARFPEGSAHPVAEIVNLRRAAAVVVRVATATGVLERQVPGMVRVPAVLRVRCTPVGEACKVGDVSVGAGATISVPSDSPTPFRIFDVSSADKAPLFDAGSLPPQQVLVVQVSGTFTSVPEQVAGTFVVGTQFPEGSAQPVAEIVALRPAAAVVVRVATATGVLERQVPGMVHVPAVLRVRCTPVGEACKVGDVNVAAGATILVPSDSATPFRILDVSSADKAPFFDAGSLRQTVEVDARLATSPETLALLTPGAADTDRRLFALEAPTPAAVLLTFKRERDIDSRSSVDWSGPDVKGAPQIYDVPRQLTILEATLRVPVERTPDGWQYKGSAVKLGAPFSFEGHFYILRGWILRVRVPPTGAAGADRSGRN